MSFQYYWRKLRDVPFKQYTSIFPMLVALFLVPFVKKKYKRIWAICERETEARDNGFHFFCYLSKEHSEQPCVYIIKKRSRDAEKVSRYGQIINWGSIKHWIFYFCSDYLISSQRFSPSGYLCAAIERAGLFHPKHVFLQHGITINKPEYLIAERRPVIGFTTATTEETEFIQNVLGYKSEQVWMTGFARFDALHSFAAEAGRIIIMPTWRKWLRLKSETITNSDDNEELDCFLNAWLDLFHASSFCNSIKEYKLKVTFVLHSNMKKIIPVEALKSEGIETVDLDSLDLQELLKKSQAIITDYSSVFFDMVYMKKAVIFYQFDEEKYRLFHYASGWFDYRNTVFGSWCQFPEEVGAELARMAQNNFVPSREYLTQHAKTFTLYDTKNCERIYETILSTKGRE